MPEQFFRFKQFHIHQHECAMKVGTDGVLLGAWASTHLGAAVLDVGTGTGLIALMLAQRFNANVDALEIDVEASEQAKQNFSLSNWANHLSVFNVPLQNYQTTNNYDLIVCNPPYFESTKGITSNNRKLARGSIALTHNELVTCSLKLLKPNGQLALILPYEQLTALIEIALTLHLHPSRITKVRGTPNVGFKRALVQLAIGKQDLAEDELIIESTRGSYTDDYKALTKDFYLAF